MFRLLQIFIVFCFCSSCFGWDSIRLLSVEEKVGQLLMAQFHGETVNEEARALIQDTKIGGIIYYNWSNGLTSPSQVRRLSQELQALSRENGHSIPLFIATDQEGGVVARLKQGFTQFPGNRALGEAGDLKLAERVGFAMAQELKAVGVNMNLAPVIDVNSNPRNPVIGIRSFGGDPKAVAVLGDGMLKGHKAAQVIATCKHFPGHGDTEVDSHEDLPVVHKKMEELRQIDLYPFAELASSADAIMTAHIIVPALDTERCATLSRKTLAYLRETLGFKGVIVSDSLVMEGVLKTCRSIDEAAIQALMAGCDLLILGGKLLSGERSGFELQLADIQQVHRAIVDGVKTGRIPEDRIDEAAQKILDLKRRYLLDCQMQLPLECAVDLAEHQVLAETVATLAIKAGHRGEEWIGPLQEKKVIVFAPAMLKETMEQTSLLKIGKTTQLRLFSPFDPTDFDLRDLKESVLSADLLVVCSYNAWKNRAQARWIQSCLDTGKPTILIALRDPLDASLFPAAQWIFQTFSPAPCSIDAVCKQLIQR